MWRARVVALLPEAAAAAIVDNRGGPASWPDADAEGRHLPLTQNHISCLVFRVAGREAPDKSESLIFLDIVGDAMTMDDLDVRFPRDDARSLKCAISSGGARRIWFPLSRSARRARVETNQSLAWVASVKEFPPLSDDG